jgi:hypothetical protein
MSDAMFAALAAPFPPERVTWRPGTFTKDKTKAKALAYIDARDVMQRLDAACGPGGWQAEYSHVAPIIICRIGVRVDGEWVWKANGAGQTDIEAEKGGASDAFKRSAVLWGVGQYLYDVDAPWVELDGNQIAKHELSRLRAMLPKPDGTPGAKAGSSYSNRKTIDWKALGEGARQCPSVTALDEYLAKHADTLATMSPAWAEKWGELVDEQREKLSQRRAAA